MQHAVDLQRIDQLIWDDYNVDIKEPNKKNHIKKFRNFYYLVAQKFTRHNDEDIGAYVNRKRCTVIIQSQKTSEILPYNKSLLQEYTEFEQKCQKKIKFKRSQVSRSRHKVLRDLDYHKGMVKFYENELKKYPAHYSET